MKTGSSEYTNLHRLIRKIKGKPSFCVSCWNPHNIQWANISGKYLKDPTDYRALCVRCHMRFDADRHKGFKKSPEMRKRLSIASKGRIPWNKGKPWSEEMKAKLKAAHPDTNGSNNPRWRGGTSVGYKMKMRGLTE